MNYVFLTIGSSNKYVVCNNLVIKLCCTYDERKKAARLFCLDNFNSLVLTDWPKLNIMYIYLKKTGDFYKLYKISTQVYTNYYNSFTITFNIIVSNVHVKKVKKYEKYDVTNTIEMYWQKLCSTLTNWCALKDAIMMEQ